MTRPSVAVTFLALTLAGGSAFGQPRSSEARLCVVVDPGHGGRDAGSVGRNGLKEKDVALDIAQRLARILETRLNVRVVLTRRGDYYVSIEDRANRANRAKDGAPADLLVSIHANACMEPAVNGFQVFYASRRRETKSDELAQMQGRSAPGGTIGGGQGIAAAGLESDIQSERQDDAAKLLADSIAASLETRLSMPKLMTASAVIRLLSAIEMPAALVEVGFLSNGTGETTLGTSGFRNMCADALAQGIAAYRDQMREHLLGALGSVGSTAAREPSTMGAQ